MAHNDLAHQFKRFGLSRRRNINFAGCILFVLLLYLESTFSTNHGDQQTSIFISFAFSLLVTKSLLAFTTHGDEAAKTQFPWHKQPHILSGIIFAAISMFGLIILIDSFTNNSLPGSVQYAICGISWLIIIVAYLRAPSTHRQKKEANT